MSYPQQEPAKPAYAGYPTQQGQAQVYAMQTHDPGLSSSTINLTSESIEEPYTCLYVMSILVSFFFYYLPCGFIGLAHVMAARADYSRGSHNLARKKRGQAMVWTGFACGFGIAIIACVVIALALSISSVSSTARSISNSYPNNFGN